LYFDGLGPEGAHNLEKARIYYIPKVLMDKKLSKVASILIPLLIMLAILWSDHQLTSDAKTIFLQTDAW